MKYLRLGMPSRPGVIALLAVCSLAFAQPVLAQWKWRDKNGQMHISDVPPPAGVADKDILQRPDAGRRAASAPQAAASVAAAASGAASAPGALEAEVEARRAKAEQEEKAKRKAAEEQAAAARAENCSRARRHVVTLESGQRIARTNDKGEREFLDDKARAEELQRARSIIGSDCK